MPRIIEEMVFIRATTEGGHSLMQRNISEKRREALGFYRGKRAGRREDKSNSQSRMDLV